MPPEIIFDQGVGSLFVVRVAGNVAGSVELDSIEYATKYLHSSLILVLGHERCGAVEAVPGGNVADIEAVSGLIQPVIKKCKSAHSKETKADLSDNCIKCNVKNVVHSIKSSSLIEKYVKEKKSQRNRGILRPKYGESGDFGIAFKTRGYCLIKSNMLLSFASQTTTAVTRDMVSTIPL